MAERKYNYSLGELLDILIIKELKHAHNPAMQKQLEQEIEDIVSDIQMHIPKGADTHITAQFLRHLCLLAVFNTLIWCNEDNARKGEPDGNLLMFTHTANGIRMRARTLLDKFVNGRIDQKVNSLAANENSQWEPKW